MPVRAQASPPRHIVPGQGYLLSGLATDRACVARFRHGPSDQQPRTGPGGGRGKPDCPVLAAASRPAAAEVFSRWVGIVQKTGFCLVSPLLGIWPRAAPRHRDHPAGWRRGLRRVCATRLAIPRPAGQRADSAVRSVVGDLLLRVRYGRAGRLPSDGPGWDGTAPWVITTVVSCLPALVLAREPWGPRWPKCCAPTRAPQRTRQLTVVQDQSRHGLSAAPPETRWHRSRTSPQTRARTPRFGPQPWNRTVPVGDRAAARTTTPL